MSQQEYQREQDLARLRARLDLALGALAEEQLAFDERQLANAPRDAAMEEERASAARSGRLGPDWAKIQSRVDLGTTSLTDVFSGRDDSPEARSLLADSRATLAKVGESLEQDDAEDNPVTSSIAELRVMTAEFTARRGGMTGPGFGPV